MILFLDFDGVLHPMFPLADRCDEENAYFSYLPRLLSVLDDFPAVEVVVSSSWRLFEQKKWLQEVPDALRSRIAGKTPHIPYPVRRQYPVNYTPEPMRYREILRYLKHVRKPNAPWVALDDDPRIFPEPCPNLIVCNDGFRDQEEAQLRAVLEGWQR